ncbi:MAG TPA: hypothetical protein VFK14_10515 [Solirubrobacterales bacterium]|nr:hypothetical protein [Solirubrobacterales bacterium]
MKHLKMLGLLAVAAAAFMAFAGNAYAENPVLTSPAGTEYTGTIHATLETGTTAKLEAGIEDTCTVSTVHGDVTTNTFGVASGPITGLSFGSEATPCSAEATTVLNPGSLSIASGGAVTATGNEVTVKQFGISCIYGGGSGTVLGSLEGGTPAKLKVNTSELPKISGGLFCASKGTWTANYVVTTPGTLLVD